MIKKHILLILSLIFFLSSVYILISNYISYTHLRAIQWDYETNKVIGLLDENFQYDYSLPENHDVNLSEDILEYLNVNRNLWQYDYLKYPVKQTDQTDYTLGHFELEDNKTTTILNVYNDFFRNWQYFKQTGNPNIIIQTEIKKLEYELYPDSEQFWHLGLQTIFQRSLKKEKANDTIIYSYENAIYVFNTSTEYPERNFDTYGIKPLQLSEEIAFCTKVSYFKKYINDIDRDVETYQDIWENGKQYFFGFMSQKRYNNLCKPIVDKLFTTYNTITQTNAYKKHFEEYNLGDPEFFALPNTEKFNYGFNWAYSFWDRRFTEGTMEYAHKVLLEIKNYYE